MELAAGAIKATKVLKLYGVFSRCLHIGLEG